VNERLPARIDRDAFDRIIKRAAELQAHGRDIGEGLSEDEVLALGKEVGIPEAQLRQALLEERTHVSMPEQHGTLDRFIAPSSVMAERVVQGTPELIGTALNRWFEQHEILVVQRSTAEKITWEQASTFAGAMKRIGWSFNSNRGKPFLDKADLVTALMTQLEPGYCHVTLVANLRQSRASFIGGGAAVTSIGAATGIVLAVLGAPLLIAGVVAVPALAGGVAVSRMFRGVNQRAHLGLERALDELERHPALPTSEAKARPRALGRDLGDVMLQITKEVKRAFEEKK
jgi:hypothetical protein